MAAHHYSSETCKKNLISLTFMKPILAICAFTAFSLFYLSGFRSHHHETAQSLRLPSRNYIDHDDDSHQNTNISHILLGIGGSAETWANRRHYCQLWWKPDTHRGFVWLDKEPEPEERGEGGTVINWGVSVPAYKVSADTSRFKYTCPYGSRSAVRMARIVKESFELGMKDVRWLVMGDDDTVFFTENLVNVLNKYDHNDMYYIGGISESVEQDVIHSYTMAYGGGGFAISRALAAELVTILDGCIDRYADFYGSDQKIGGCVSDIGVPLTRELGFHQIDIRGSSYGILAAHPLAPLVSLHHLDHVQPLFPGMTRIQAVEKLMKPYKHDPSRLLQHTFCYDPTRKWSVSISWGYTVQLYPFLVRAKDLSTTIQTFVSWRSWSREAFSFDTRIMSTDPCERPIIFYVEDEVHHDLGNGGSTRTTYTRKSVRMKTRCDREDYAAAYRIKGFNVSAAVLDPQIWKKAPRRQCCEIMEGSSSGDMNIMMNVRLRACNSWESVTPA